MIDHNTFHAPKWNKATKTWERPLDRKYLRLSSVYRLLSRGRIGYNRAFELLARRHTHSEMKVLRATVELWRSGPLRHIAIAA